MKLHDPALMTALLDGELKGWRRWLVRRHAASCPTCALEYRQQQHARQLLRENPPRYAMSDSPDFFWSKVRNEIQKRGAEQVDIPVARLSLADWLWQRPAALATAAAAVVALVVTISFVQLRPRPEEPQIAQVIPAVTDVERVSTSIPNTIATTFHSDDATVIWVSGLPWTPDMTEMNTLFANLDS